MTTPKNVQEYRDRVRANLDAAKARYGETWRAFAAARDSGADALAAALWSEHVEASNALRLADYEMGAAECRDRDDY